MSMSLGLSYSLSHMRDLTECDGCDRWPVHDGARPSLTGSGTVCGVENRLPGGHVPKATRPIYASWPLKLHSGKVRRWMRHGTVEYRVRVRTTWFVLRQVPWKGICVIAEHEPGAHGHPGEVPSRVWEYPSMAIKKRDAAKVEAIHLAAVECKTFDGLMPLVEHMALRQYEDATPREPGWITIKTQGSAWVVQVKDPDSVSSFSAVAETLDKALETAALLLSCDDAPWELDRWLQDAAARKKKK